ncbi:MAG: GGDEF domain-containing protein [Pseudomonadota bacterium]
MASRRKTFKEGSQADPRQATRLRRLLTACLIPATYMLGLTALYLLAMMNYQSLLNAAAILGGCVAFFFFLIVSRLNLKCPDKNLTAEMALAMIMAMMWILYETPASHIIFGPFALLIMMASAFRAQQRALATVALFVLMGGALIIYLHQMQSENNALFTLELLHWGVLTVTIPGFVLLGSRVRRLYRALYKAGVQIENIEEHARRDELTGCFNRRYMMAALQKEKHQADVEDENLCLAVIDLDHFKRINDEIGHLAGDKVLRSFAQLAQQSIRREDVFGRYGGEEFLLILPGIELLDALNTVERIRAITEHQVSKVCGLNRKVTVSVGVTQYISGESVLDVFSRADAAMYLAKTGGRNQVVVEEPRPM